MSRTAIHHVTRPRDTCRPTSYNRSGISTWSSVRIKSRRQRARWRVLCSRQTNGQINFYRLWNRHYTVSDVYPEIDRLKTSVRSFVWPVGWSVVMSLSRQTQWQRPLGSRSKTCDVAHEASSVSVMAQAACRLVSVRRTSSGGRWTGI